MPPRHPGRWHDVDPRRDRHRGLAALGGLRARQPRASHVHVGSLHAPDADMAVRNARDLYTRRNEGVSIWVVPADAITTSDPDAKGAFFESPAGKNYRHAVVLHGDRGGAAPVSDPRRRHGCRDGDRPARRRLRRPARARRRARRRRRHGAGHVARRMSPSTRCGSATTPSILSSSSAGGSPAPPSSRRTSRSATSRLDLLGHARSLLHYAGTADGRSEDDLAYWRDEPEFRSAWLFEQPNGDFAHTIARQLVGIRLPVRALLARCSESTDATLAAIAAKAVKEVDYHRDHADPVDAAARAAAPTSRAGA